MILLLNEMVMVKVLSLHAVEYDIFNTCIDATTYGELVSFLTDDLYFIHMPCIVFLLLLLYGAYVVARRPFI